jgi:TPR repeat protein
MSSSGFVINLASVLEAGAGGSPQDLSEAALWYRQAADQGNALDQLRAAIEEFFQAAAAEPFGFKGMLRHSGIVRNRAGDWCFSRERRIQRTGLRG